MEFSFTIQNTPCRVLSGTEEGQGCNEGEVRRGKAQGGDFNIKMPRCVCLVSENIPILNDTLSCKTYPY